LPGFREHPAAAFLRGMAEAESGRVPLDRVIRQRAIFAEVSATALLEPSLQTLLEKSCRAAAEGCEVRMAKVLEHVDGELLISATFGLDPEAAGTVRIADDPGNPAGECFQTGVPTVLPDVRRCPDYHLPPIYPRHGVVSTVNVPIVGRRGRYGVLEIDCTEEREFDALDITFLASIAGTIADAVERVRRHSALQAAHDAREQLLREHHHRVRNGYQVILGQLELHAMHATTENSRRRFEEVERRVFAMAALYDYLVGTGLPEGRIDFCRYIADLCGRMREFYGIDEIGVELACHCPEVEVCFGIDTATAFGTVVNELVANATEHAFGGTGGRIDIRIENGADGAALTVADDGTGFDQAEAQAIGLGVVRRLVEGAGGSLTRLPTERGTTWRIALPRGRAAAAAA
jgi:two-component sensor histidine kinase